MTRRVPFPWLLLPALTFVCACGGTTATELSGPGPVRCGISLSPAPPLPASDAVTTLTLETTRDCTWSLSVNAGWLRLSPASGQGSATIAVSAADNSSHELRQAVISVNGSSWTLTQAGAPVPPPPQSPSSPPQGPQPPSPPPDEPAGGDNGGSGGGDGGGSGPGGRGGRGGGRGGG